MTDFLRIDEFELLAVQGTLKSLLQHHSSKASILCHSAFFMVQLSHPYMTTGNHLSQKSLSRVRLFATPWTVAHQAPPSMESPGENTGVSCHFLLQGIFPTQGLNPGLPHCRQRL